jgi:hypothetical protein
MKIERMLGVSVVAMVALAQAPPARTVPAARIVAFQANPSTVDAGKAVQLVWATENPTSALIEPEVGPVSARGAMMVKPAASTTYTLTVNGPNGTKLTQEVHVVVQGGQAAAKAAATGAPAKVNLRMPDGTPDFNGVYGSTAVRNLTPPALVAGAEKFRVQRGGPGDLKSLSTLGVECLPLGVPQAYMAPYPFQIVQTPKMMVMIHEYPNTFRMIPLDGRAHTPDPDPAWNGEAVGHWEGDTLVIDTIGFNDRTEVSGFMHTEQYHVVERYKRLDNGNLQYDVTVEDPNVWTTPWTMPQRVFPFHPEAEHVDEFVCETNIDYSKLYGNK